jgi:hypothetical protein
MPAITLAAIPPRHDADGNNLMAHLMTLTIIPLFSALTLSTPTHDHNNHARR